MAVELTLPTLPVVISTALIDSINPCAIGVLIILITALLGMHNDRKKMLLVGTIYISAVFVTYLAAGLSLLVFIQKFDLLFQQWFGISLSILLSWVVGGIVIALGFIEIKDFFWYGKGISLQIPKNRAKQIMKYIDNVSIPGSIFLGAFVAAVELPCTGGPYLAITTLLSRIGLSWKVFGLLVLYNIIFVMPLIVILVLAFFGVKTDTLKNWKDDKKKWMRLFIGLVMVALGVLLILWANGVIDFGLSI